MHRLLRAFPPFTGLGLFFVLAASCGKLPLLAPTGTVINLTITSDTAALNSSVDIIAVLIENGQQSGGTGTGTAATSSSTTGAGTPVQNGTVVSFTTSLGTIEPAEAKTENGKVSVKLKTTGESGTATVTAYSGGAKSTAQIKVGAANAKAVTLTASPQNLPSTGGPSTIAARVDDSNGNGLAGVSVIFSTTKGALSSSTVTTNSSGIATTTLTTTAGADVTATVGALTGKVTIGVSTRASLTITGPSAAVSAGAVAAFTISAGSGTTIIPLTNVSVSFGDGTSKSLGTVSGSQSLSHIYANSGIFDVTASGIDPDGVVNTAIAQVAITASKGTIALSAASSPVAISAPEIFTIDVGTTIATTNISINYGDGTSRALGSFSGSKADTKFYSTPGTYTVTASGTDPDGVVKTSSTIITVIGLSASVSGSAATITRGTSITFTATVTPTAASIDHYTWDFGDGSTATSTGSAQNHVYATTLAPSTLTVTARVFPVYGTSFTVSMPIAVLASKGSINLTSTVTSIGYSTITPFTIDAGTVAMTNIKIDYGDGSSASLGSFSGTRGDSHIYSTPGTYTVTATGTDPDGVVATSTLKMQVVQLTVTVAQPTALASSSPISFTATVAAINSQSALIANYHWYFDDGLGGDSTSNTITHKYAPTTPSGSSARYTVTVTVTPVSGATFSYTFTIVVTS